MSAATALPPVSSADIQASFVRALPRIRAHARYALRRAPAADRDDLVAEVLALSWKHFADLSRRGRRPEEFVTTLALRCSQAVRGGRRVTGSEETGKTMPETVVTRFGFPTAARTSILNSRGKTRVKCGAK